MIGRTVADVIEAWQTPCDHCQGTGRDGYYACQACDRMGDDEVIHDHDS